MTGNTDYIFCINAGRSGSNYLKTIFDHVWNCRAFHEPQPIGNGAAMRRYSKGHVGSMERIAQDKAEMIRSHIRDRQLYFESNHTFIKGFGWFIPRILPEDRIGVIILKRERSRIAESLLRVGCSPLCSLGRNWITTPDTRQPLVMPPVLLISPRLSYYIGYASKLVIGSANFICRKISLIELQIPDWLVEYERTCLEWYVDETAAKGESFKRQFPKIKYYDVSIDELNSLDNVHKMLAYFGCQAKSSLSGVVGKATNLKR